MKNLLFKNRLYRKMYLLNLKAKIMKPINYIKAMWKLIKLYRDYPDRWERYVRLKEEEAAAEEQRKMTELVIAKSNFIGAAFQINLCQLFVINPENPKEQKEEIFAEFQQRRKELQEAIEYLEEHGTSVPEELKSYLLETPIGTFKSIEEWKMFEEDSFIPKIKLINDF